MSINAFMPSILQITANAQKRNLFVLETFKDPDFEIFRWCIIQNRKELARLLLEHSKVNTYVNLAIN